MMPSNEDVSLAEPPAIEFTVSEGFVPAAEDGWIETSQGVWEKQNGASIVTYTHGEAAALRAIEAIRNELDQIRRETGDLTFNKKIRIGKLEQAENSFSVALGEMRSGLGRAATGHLGGSYCDVSYDLNTRLDYLGFWRPHASASATAFYFPFGPIDPSDPTVRYTFTKTWVYDAPSGRFSSTSDLDYITQIGYTSSDSMAELSLSGGVNCSANAEAYYVVHSSQTCTTSVIGTSIRLWQTCNTF